MACTGWESSEQLFPKDVNPFNIVALLCGLPLPNLLAIAAILALLHTLKT